ncbi:hypothetical protein PBI_BEAGLE_60 [Arthrobacter phage Beagle]|nr:hypothetical protein PBI_BEAGLE_60 [Arthrobacter phage Beagle]
MAALIRQSLAEQDAEDSLWGGYVRHAVNADGTPDLTDVTIDGHYDLVALAESIITEVRSEYE